MEIWWQNAIIRGSALVNLDGLADWTVRLCDAEQGGIATKTDGDRIRNRFLAKFNMLSKAIKMYFSSQTSTGANTYIHLLNKKLQGMAKK